MGVWDIYQSRAEVRGETKRDAALKRKTLFIQNHSKDSLSYDTVLIDDEEREVSVINSDNLNEKLIISKPNEDLRNGALVEWMGNHWLIIERDANTTVYTKCKMLQCNYLLKWVSKDGCIYEQWCIIEDGTKLMCMIHIYNSLAYWKRHVKTTS